MGHRYASTVVGVLCARSAVGHQSASTVVYALRAKSAVVHQYASTVVGALSARSAVGHQSASTVVSAIDAKSAVGDQSASTVVGANDARSAVGHRYASTVVYAVSARSVVVHKLVPRRRCDKFNLSLRRAQPTADISRSSSSDESPTSAFTPSTKPNSDGSPCSISWNSELLRLRRCAPSATACDSSRTARNN